MFVEKAGAYTQAPAWPLVQYVSPEARLVNFRYAFLPEAVGLRTA